MRTPIKAGLALLILASVANAVLAQNRPPAAAALSTDEIIERVIASRPKGKRTLVMPKLFDALEDKSTEQNVQPSSSGMSAWRDTYGKDGAVEFAFRQVFTPLKTWQQKKPRQMLDDAKAQIMEGNQAMLLEERDFTLDTFPGRSFVVKHSASGKVVRLDYLLITPDLFIVSCSGTEADLKSPKVVKFFADLKTEPVK